ITEISLDLAGDRRHGEADEAAPVLRVVAVDGVDQAQEGDLLEVLDFDSPIGVAVGEVEGQWPIQLEQFAAGFVIRQTAKQSLGSFVVHSSLHGRVDLSTRSGTRPIEVAKTRSGRSRSRTLRGWARHVRRDNEVCRGSDSRSRGCSG